MEYCEQKLRCLLRGTASVIFAKSLPKPAVGSYLVEQKCLHLEKRIYEHTQHFNYTTSMRGQFNPRWRKTGQA